LKVLKDKQVLTPSEGTSKRGKKRLVHSQQGTEMADIVPYLSAPTDPSSSSSAMVMADHADDWKHRMRVDLDDDTLRVYDALVEWDKIDSESFQGVDIGSGPGWNKTRQDYEILVRRFISTVRECLFGNSLATLHPHIHSTKKCTQVFSILCFYGTHKYKFDSII
jgi:hypothetical protein